LLIVGTVNVATLSSAERETSAAVTSVPFTAKSPLSIVSSSIALLKLTTTLTRLVAENQ